MRCPPHDRKCRQRLAHDASQMAAMTGITEKAVYIGVMMSMIRTARLTLAALCVTLLPAVTPAMADPTNHDWIPAEITLPEDMEVVIDRSIGSANRLLSFTTDADADALATTWREALENGPYQVEPTAEGMDGRLIAFSGGRVQNGQISFLPGADSTRTTVQFDASIND
jgi:hypothetical protein